MTALAAGVLLAAVGGTFLYLQWSAEQAFAEQTSAAANYIRACLAGDDATLKTLLPPDTVAALPADWFVRDHVDWPTGCTLSATGVREGSTVKFAQVWESTQVAQDLVMSFGVSTSSGDDAVVTWATRSASNSSIDDSGTIMLRRIGGAWRVARDLSGPHDQVFWDGLRNAGEIARTLDANLPPAQPAPASADQASGGLPSGHPSIVDTSTSSPGVAPSSGSFDPATATRVPAGQTPRDFVSAYYQAILDKQWQKAFDMQPEASKAGQTVDGFQQTQEQMYGMKKFSIFSANTSGSQATVVAVQDLGDNGIWNATWTFAEDGGAWLVKSRAAAMGEPTK
jgi:hypothetical protein